MDLVSLLKKKRRGLTELHKRRKLHVDAAAEIGVMYYKLKYFLSLSVATEKKKLGERQATNSPQGLLKESTLSKA